MNIYDRIINILLEARVEMFIQDRLDEANLLDKGKSDEEKRAARIARSGESNVSRMIGHKVSRGKRLQGRQGNRPGKEDFAYDEPSSTIRARLAARKS
jgi:hypothetical protein